MTIYKYFIQNNDNPYKKEVFKTTTKGYIPPGWTLIREIEKVEIDFKAPLPYGENNPLLHPELNKKPEKKTFWQWLFGG